ncbi:MAG: hypothetical protein FH748_10750 [Balneolaceae bacterium]|nr:hypothetical protein [Balneolaceae bacterium]
MKQSKLSKKLNLLGEVMKLTEAFNKLRQHKHSNSFERLDEWLDQNHSKSKKMKSIYKTAASFIFLVLVFIACSMPVEHEEKIGYMIKGVTSLSETEMLRENMKEFGAIMPQKINYSSVLHETKDGEAEQLVEVVFVFPETHHEKVLNARNKLASTSEFKSLELLPISEKVERSLFKSTLNKLDLHLEEEEIEVSPEEKMKQFVKIHSTISAKDIRVTTDKDGNKVTEIVIDKLGEIEE